MTDGRRETSQIKEYVLKTFKAPVDLSAYEAELNPAQLQAVTAGRGPHLVIAGAGSGKTRVITYRVAYLIDQGTNPSRILLVTFTNKAAREMLRRVTEVTRGDSTQVWGGTFHHIGNMILRRHATLVGLTNSYTILDREDAKELLQVCVTDLGISVTKHRFPKGDVLQDILSTAINAERSVAHVLEDRYPFFTLFEAEILAIGRRYRERKFKDNLVDYDDLLSLWLRLLKEHPEVLDSYRQRFLHVLCDEYQDTNAIQGEILDLLASHHRNLMVVGDDAQSIFAFRGAKYANILRFTERYPDAQVHKLETNYRSTPEVLDLANASILHNIDQYHKTLRPVRPSGPKPALTSLTDEEEQAAFVAQRALELRDEAIPLNDMAVLYRAHFQSIQLQLELTRRGIPFDIRSGLRFYEQAHVKDVVAYLRIVVNPKDELAWKRAVKLHPGIGNATAEQIWQAVASQSGQLDLEALKALAPHLGSRARRGFQEFLTLLTRLFALPQAPAEMIDTVLDGVYQEYLKTRYPNWASRLEDLQQLATFALRYPSLEAFLTELSLTGVITGEDVVWDEPRDELLILSTIHQAKGLEWSVVFLIWLVDGWFPSAAGLREEGGLEEERRLFYVATTRAKEHLYLCHPQRGTDFRRRELILKPSRFVHEISDNLYEQWHVRME
ncbi:MAG: ATP-dependent helicase [Candidatus Methylomirabilales bacterium]|nr:ATP-dependent helicase [candidate division NC10 bacterium]